MSATWINEADQCYCEWCEPDGECGCVDCEGK